MIFSASASTSGFKIWLLIPTSRLHFTTLTFHGKSLPCTSSCRHVHRIFPHAPGDCIRLAIGCDGGLFEMACGSMWLWLSFLPCWLLSTAVQIAAAASATAAQQAALLGMYSHST